MKPIRGFSLIELSIVLFIGAMLLTMGLRAVNTQLDNSAYSSTKARQEIIKDALSGYLGKNGRLPCPDTSVPPDGIGEADRNNVGGILACANLLGVVPYADLGLSKEMALDGWENFISYGVSQRWTLTYNSAAAPPVGAPAANTAQTSFGVNAFNIDALGNITVNDRVPATGAIINPPPTTVAVVVLISHGKNGLGATTINGTPNVLPPGADELANLAAGGPFFKREYTDNQAAAGGAFDDVVRVIQASELVSPLTKDGSFAASSGSLNQTTSTIADAILGATLANYQNGPKAYFIPASAAALGVSLLDPWGNQIVYLPTCLYTQSAPPPNCLNVGGGNAGIPQNANTQFQAGVPVPAYTLTSNGKDGAPGGGDDIVISVPMLQIKGVLAKSGWP